MTDHEDSEWIAAMFGGIDRIIDYYEPIIVNKAFKFQDKSRATLNDIDLRQVCRMAVARAWERQCTSQNIVNFDMLVKWCMDNALKTEVSREFTLKRGKVKLCFMSEMEHNTEGEDSNGLAERNIYRAQREDGRNCAGMDFLIHDLRDALPGERLKRTFTAVLEGYPPEYLDPNNLSTSEQTEVASKLCMSAEDLLSDLRNIQFVFHGIRDRYL